LIELVFGAEKWQEVVKMYGLRGVNSMVEGRNTKIQKVSDSIKTQCEFFFEELMAEQYKLSHGSEKLTVSEVF
jgi:hypothetical protein